VNNPRNIWLFLRLLLTHPLEFFDRTGIILQREGDRLFFRDRQSDAYPERISFADGLRGLSEALGRDLAPILAEPELQNIRNHVADLTLALNARANLPFPTKYNADSTVAALAYLLPRVLEAQVVVETGVAYGVTSAAILAALGKNKRGALYSVDLPPISDRASRACIGMMVPGEYKDRWHLHLGPSKRVLPNLFADGIGEVDVFLHGSANIYQVQRTELETVWPRMSSRGAIIVDGIHTTPAFAEFVKEKNVDCWFALEQKEKADHLIGVILRH
jgi:predicted O-methyltransferase YrrM